jgi:hypothetical protein
MKIEYVYTQGLTDHYWYYARSSELPMPVDAWTGPFQTRTNAVNHSEGVAQESAQNYD